MIVYKKSPTAPISSGVRTHVNLARDEVLAAVCRLRHLYALRSDGQQQQQQQPSSPSSALTELGVGRCWSSDHRESSVTTGMSTVRASVAESKSVERKLGGVRSQSEPDARRYLFSIKNIFGAPPARARRWQTRRQFG